MRARGLKLIIERTDRLPELSRPMRARGLKPVIILHKAAVEAVAPHAGAWVETVIRIVTITNATSRPMRARGLKLQSRSLQ